MQKKNKKQPDYEEEDDRIEKRMDSWIIFKDLRILKIRGKKKKKN